MAGNKNSGRRPRFVTEEERARVRVLKNGGMSNLAIATVLGISEPTLVRHFSSDIAVGAAVVTAEILMMRYNCAKLGNVSAQNKLLDRAGVQPPAAAVVAKVERPENIVKMGKKEIAQVEAETAHEGSDWGSLLQ